MGASAHVRLRGVAWGYVSAIALTAALVFPIGSGARAQQASEEASASGVTEAARLDKVAALEAGAGRISGSEEIVVTGSRIARSGFDTPTPVTVVGQESIQNLGLVNTGEVVNQLPSVRASLAPTNNGFGSFNVGAQVPNLRGLSSLAANRTLVLVNGKRFVPTSREGSVDLNMIPTLMIDRLEVVTGGASAVYGSDAVAGVVNVILNTSLTGVRSQLDYGISEEGDGEQFHAAIAAGSDFMDGRLHIVGGAEYTDRKGIGSCFTRDWCTTAGIVQSATAVPRYQIHREGVGFLATKGGALPLFGNPALAGSPFANVQFGPDGSIIPYQPGILRGATNQYGGTISSPYETTNISVPSRTYSLYGHATFEASDNIDLWLDASYGNVTGTNVGAATWDNPIRNAGNPNYFLIRPDNPFIPQPLANYLAAHPTIPGLNLYRLGNDLGLSTAVSSGETWRTAAGIQGKVFEDRFHWDAYYSYGRSTRNQTISGTRVQSNFYRAVDAVLDPATGRPVCRDTLSSDPAVRAAAAGCVPLNLFGIGQWSPEAQQYSYGASQPEELKLTQNAAGLNLSGDLINLPAGPLGVAIGGEWRKEKANLVHSALGEALAFYQNFGKSYAGSVDVVEGYVEVSAPVLKDSPIGSLIVDGAARRTRYNNTNLLTDESKKIHATTWKVSAVYDPMSWLSIRATRSRDIRAPSFNELYAAAGSSFTGYLNQRLPGNPAQFPFTATGGNINLHAEVANTLTVGAVLRPTSGLLDRLRLSVDYYDIKLGGAIGTLGGGSIVNRCFDSGELCNLVDFDAAGNLSVVRNVNLNLDELVSRGIDIEFDYSVPVGPGTLRARVLANHALAQQTKTSTATFDYLGVTGPSGTGVPDWTVNAALTYATGPAQVTLQSRFISAGAYNNDRIGPNDSRYEAAIASCLTAPAGPLCANTINDNTVDGAVYFNLSGSYDLIERGNGLKLQLFGSINNLLNRNPPLAPDGTYPTNPVFFDQIGRFFRVGARMSF